MNFALLLVAIPICIADVTSYVIPNIYTKILLYAALLHLYIFGLGPLRDLLVSAALLMFLVFLGIGMGDIKLLGLIIITHPFNVFEYLLNTLLVAGVHILVLIGLHRSIPSKIPLAPSIFIALLTYLAAR